MKRPNYFELTHGKKYYLKLYTVWRGYAGIPRMSLGLGRVKLVLGAAIPNTLSEKATGGERGIAIYRSPDAFAPAWIPAGEAYGYPAPQ